MSWETMTERERDAWLQNHVYPDTPVVFMKWPCGYTPDCGVYEADVSLEPEPEMERCSWYTERGPVIEAFPGGWLPNGEGIVSVHPVSHYTTDDAAALRLAEAMRQKGWNYSISYHGSDGSTSPPYFASFQEESGDRKARSGEGFARGDSFREALCLAVYRAFGGD